MRPGPSNTPGARDAAVRASAIARSSSGSAARPRRPPGFSSASATMRRSSKPERGALEILTTDALVEGIHFDRRFSTPARHRLEGAGRQPLRHRRHGRHAAAGAALARASRRRCRRRLRRAARRLRSRSPRSTGVTLAGGNITRSPGPLFVDVTRHRLRRAAASPARAAARRPGDDLYVTGDVGAAAAGLRWLRDARHRRGRQMTPRSQADASTAIDGRSPRARIGALLGRNRAASACMDLSDGLADAVRQMADARRAPARASTPTPLPIHPRAPRLVRARPAWSRCRGAAGGDDYELLFAVPRRARGRLRHGHPAGPRRADHTHWRADRGPRPLIARQAVVEPLPAGFVHF